MKKFMISLALAAAFLGAPVSQAVPITFDVILNGASESPPNASPGTSTATIIFDIVAQTMSVDIAFSGLLGLTTASHIHCCTAVPGAGLAGVATVVPNFTGFPLGVTSGTYFHVFDMSLASSYNPAFIGSHGGTVASAEAALFTGMLDGASYLNIHTSVVPGGEIRGFLVEAVPEPASLALLGLGLAGLGFSRRKKA